MKCPYQAGSKSPTASKNCYQSRSANTLSTSTTANDCRCLANRIQATIQVAEAESTAVAVSFLGGPFSGVCLGHAWAFLIDLHASTKYFDADIAAIIKIKLD